MRPVLPRAQTVLPYLERMDRSQVYTNFGPLCIELEERYATLLAVPPERVVTAANATIGLTGAMSCLPEILQWVLPAWSFAATGQALHFAQGSPIWADIDAKSWLVTAPDENPDSSTGLLAVTTFGSEVELHRWSKWRHVVIDAAASLGSMPNLALLPTGWAVVFSLHATKVLGCGEGSIVVFGSADAAKRFRSWTNFAFDDARQSTFPGTNGKMPEVTCAYAHAALDGWAVEAAQWDEVDAVQAALEGEFGLQPAPSRNSRRHPYWVVDCGSGEARAEVERALSAQGIQSRRWWPGLLTQMPAFRGNLPPQQFPIAEKKAKAAIGLPKFRGLSAADSRRVSEIVAGALDGNLGTHVVQPE
jgi:dTDP-4-amino-4,6-dideoxygalactose transaminase